MSSKLLKKTRHVTVIDCSVLMLGADMASIIHATLEYKKIP